MLDEKIMKLEKRLLLISNCHANCPKCKLPTEFQMFESGMGGDFQTYMGEKTGDLYRINLELNTYLNIPLENLISPIIEREGDKHLIRKIPDNLKCKLCGMEFVGNPAFIDGEEQKSIFEVIK